MQFYLSFHLFPFENEQEGKRKKKQSDLKQTSCRSQIRGCSRGDGQVFQQYAMLWQHPVVFATAMPRFLSMTNNILMIPLNSASNAQWSHMDKEMQKSPLLNDTHKTMKWGTGTHSPLKCQTGPCAVSLLNIFLPFFHLSPCCHKALLKN